MVRTSRPAVLGASAAAVFAGMASNPILSRHMPVFDKPNDQGVSDVEFKTAVRELKKVTDEVKGFAEKAHTEIKNLGEMSDDTKEALDKVAAEQVKLNAQVADIEQKISRRGGCDGDAVEHKSLGQKFVDTEDYRNFGGSGSYGKIRMSTKAITSATGSGTSSSTALVQSDRQPGMLMLPWRKLVIRDLLTKRNTVSNSIEWVQQTSRTINAAPVAEAPSASKPESSFVPQMVNTPVQTLAHIYRASKQVLDDAPYLQSLIDTEMREGLARVEEMQLVLGSGASPALFGMMPQATAFTKPTGAAAQTATAVDVLRWAMLQLEIAFFVPSAIVLHPTDWANIESQKDSTNAYLFANPHAGMLTRSLWGLPVVATPLMTQGQFLMADFSKGVIYDREETNVLLSTEDADNFRTNMVTIRAEQRLALAVEYPQAFVKGSLTPPV